MKKISIISPVYNETEVIEAFAKRLFEVLAPMRDRYEFEVIFVMDRSTDDTLEKLKNIASTYPGVVVLSLSTRFGHQMSLVAGMDRCTGDAAIMLDSDLQHPPELIPELLRQYEAGYDIVHTIRTYGHQVSLLKSASSKLFYKLLNYLSSVNIEESAADFRLVSKRVLDIFKHNIREQNQFLRGLFSWIGFKQISVPFTANERESGRSKYSLIRLINFAGLGIISFSKKPLKIAITVGMFISFASICYGIYAVVQYFFLKQLPAGWTSLIATVSFLGGLQLIFLGVIGEYIAGIFDEVKHRPLYLVEKEITSRKAQEQEGSKT